MRHLKAGKRLNVTTSHRKALIRNLVTSLLENGEIKTTLRRAKEMRKYFDKMIGFAKKGDLHARRQAMSFVKTKKAITKLFDDYGPLYAQRNGGYTRIFRIGQRLGDNAKLALIQMVDIEGKTDEKTKKTTSDIKDLKKELLPEGESKGKLKIKGGKKTAKEEKPVTEKKAKTKAELKVKAAKAKKSDEKVTEEKPKMKPAEAKKIKKST
ncbi:MAG: 50S ribosomal protein L17 [Deltaproteobacteria bacterium]|nr:50S ribosomal protein L17 [Deltaproteobacteria bacterium]